LALRVIGMLRLFQVVLYIGLLGSLSHALLDIYEMDMNWR
jgi:hypothetical protein